MGNFAENLNLGNRFRPPCRDVANNANSKRPLLIIPKVQPRLRITRRSATALARYPQKLAKIVGAQHQITTRFM